MERLTRYETPAKHAYVDRRLVSLNWYSETDEGFKGPAIDRLASYEDVMTLERAQDLAQAEQDGLLVVLPCKVGDTVYLPLRDGIHGVRVKGIRISASGKDTVLHLDIGAGEFRWGSDKGRTWFTTKKEAEAANHCTT